MKKKLNAVWFVVLFFFCICSFAFPDGAAAVVVHNREIRLYDGSVRAKQRAIRAKTINNWEYIARTQKCVNSHLSEDLFFFCADCFICVCVCVIRKRKENYVVRACGFAFGAVRIK